MSGFELPWKYKQQLNACVNSCVALESSVETVQTNVAKISETVIGGSMSETMGFIGSAGDILFYTKTSSKYFNLRIGNNPADAYPCTMWYSNDELPKTIKLLLTAGEYIYNASIAGWLAYNSTFIATVTNENWCNFSSQNEINTINSNFGKLPPYESIRYKITASDTASLRLYVILMNGVVVEDVKYKNALLTIVCNTSQVMLTKPNLLSPVSNGLRTYKYDIQNVMLTGLDLTDFSRTHIDIDKLAYCILNIKGVASPYINYKGHWLDNLGVVAFRASTTVTHFAPIEDPELSTYEFAPCENHATILEHNGFKLGGPCFASGKVYARDLKHWFPSTDADTTDCICSVTSSGEDSTFVGIVTDIHPECNSIIFATHGDYLVRVDDDVYGNVAIGDVLAYESGHISKMSPSTPITVGLQKRIIGTVTGKLDNNMIAVFKTG